MKRFSFKLIIFFALICCNSKINIDNKNISNCSDNAFTNIDSAIKCGSDPKNYKSLLFAMVSSEVEKNQQKGWNILEDKEIINRAKRDYILTIIDPSKIVLSQNSGVKEFADIIKEKRNETYFVVTNHAFYPFREFTLSKYKDKIIDDLNIGEGP